jgi:hypothetical protein
MNTFIDEDEIILSNEGGHRDNIVGIFDVNADEIALPNSSDRNNKTSIDIKEELQQMSKESGPGESLQKPSTAAGGSIRIKKSTHLNASKYRQIEIQHPLPRSKNISRQSIGGI